ncbi:exopolysaccharide biosynthesis polyprenyl glycosylphosphotransferase [Pontibacter qinzhouensis]|uniref:Exopolysaccharide biosynthesis polyprenyl glycosylphosphotransferase n=1 Tax=Pontibacter qinzhouensis TaxID=2603253 RepID=A0A5C8K633_9BACT|nr:exopolysaccharide biosynthesis polyprenyl glycosylphosphotransferase [Pontibacter qinzhouensis]TXK46760.1 exopolysaccharide biosynthesis polyprenyl glycosylphosphotransferase [Pontibacter qinzhouensis]
MLSLIITFFIAVFLFNNNIYRQSEWLIFFGMLVLWLSIGYWQKHHAVKLYSRQSHRLYTFLKAYVLLIAFAAFLFLLFPLQEPARNVVAAIIVAFPLLTVPLNFLLMALIANPEPAAQASAPEVSQKKPEIDKHIKYILVAGTGNLAESVERHIYTHQKPGFEVKGFIHCKKNDECFVAKSKVVSDLKHIHEYLKENLIDEIVIALPVNRYKKIKNILAAADYFGVRVKFIPDYKGLFGNSYKMTRYGELDAVNVRQLPLDETFSFALKNSFDKLFSAIALVLLSPVFLVIAVLIKLDSPGPVFYCPIRVGRAGRPFRVFKFRSMCESDHVAAGALSTQKNDPRITKLGRILRKYSLDELPQFLNVLLGNMSVVGPRPHRSYLNQQLQESVDKYMIRHYFKPGITGWAQVNGWRGPTETAEQRTQRTQHDIWYMENWSLWLDIRIIYKTIFSRKVHKSAF